MEEQRRGGFRVKPSFGQVLSYIQEGEPLALDLPNRKASIYTSSHLYLDDYPNATLNPAAAFETADEGYDGVPFPRPPREFTRPSFLPDSDDGGTDPGQALRNDGLDPPRPPTLGGRMRESGIQAAEAIVAAAVRSVSENQTMNVLRGGGDWLDRTLRIPSRRDWRRLPTRCRPPRLLEGPAKWSPCCRGRGRRRWSARRRRTSSASPRDGGGGSSRRFRFGGGGGGRRSRDRRCGRSDRGTGGRGGGGGRGRHGLGDRGRSHRGLPHAGLGRGDGRRHGQRRLAALPTHVQTLNGMQDSGAVDHFFIQEQRQQPRVFRIDTDSESEPQAQPRQQIRARPIRRQGQGRQQPTPFGINQVPIPVSSGSERSRISRQYRGDRGPLATPSFDALRTASEPEAA